MTTLVVCFGESELTINKQDYLLFSGSQSSGYCLVDGHACAHEPLIIDALQPDDLHLVKSALSFTSEMEPPASIQGNFVVTELVVKKYFGAAGAGLTRWVDYLDFLFSHKSSSTSVSAFLSFFMTSGRLLFGGFDFDPEVILAQTDFPAVARRACAIRIDPFHAESPVPCSSAVLVAYGLPSSVVDLLDPLSAVVAGPAAAHMVQPQLTIPAIDIHVFDVDGSSAVIQGIASALRAANRVVCSPAFGDQEYIVAVAPSNFLQINVIRTRAKNIETVLRGFGTVSNQACFDGSHVHLTAAAKNDHDNFTTTYTYITEDRFPPPALPSGFDERRDACLSPEAPVIVQDSIIQSLDLVRSPESVGLSLYFQTYVHSLYRPEWFGSVANAISNLEPFSVLPLCVVIDDWSPGNVLNVKVLRPESRSLFASSLLGTHLIDNRYLSLPTQVGETFDAPVEWYNLGELIDEPSLVSAWTFLQLRCKITYSDELQNFRIQLESAHIVL